MASQNLCRDEVLELLGSRYLANQIYTELGSLTVSINPFKLLPIYSSGVVHSYASLNSLPTHIFGFADRVYATMISEKSDQAILISGESGSGKTEASKLILQFLTQSKSRGLQARNSIDLASNATLSSGVTQPTDNLLQAMVLFQYFSHAQTKHHANASRCWSWIDLLFDVRGNYSGAKLNALLLETARVSNVSSLNVNNNGGNFLKNEKNFHIFYLLCEHRAHPRLAGLNLLPSSEFAYLIATTEEETKSNGGDCGTLSDYESVDALEMNLKAFRSLGFEDDELNVILRLLAGILHLGNVKLVPTDESGNNDGSTTNSNASVTIANPSQLDFAAKMLQVNAKNLRAALLRPSLAESIKSRDVLAQDIYLGLFNELINLINNGLVVESAVDEDSEATQPSSEFLTLSLLDVFQSNDSETKKEGSFMSLLTQCGDARLMLHFYQHMFMNEQKVYEEDDIKVSHLLFPSYQPVQDRLLKLETELKQFETTHTTDQQPYLSIFAVHPLLREILTNSLDGRSPDKIPALWQGKLEPRKDFTDILTKLQSVHCHFLRCVRPNREMKSDFFDKTGVMEQLEVGSVFHAVKLKTEGYPCRARKPEFFHRFQFCLTPTQRRKDFLAKKTSMPVVDLIDMIETLAIENNIKSFSKNEIQIGKKMVFWTLVQQEAFDSLLIPERTRAAIKIQSFLRGCLIRKGNPMRKQTYQKARSLILAIKNYTTTDPEILKDVLSLATTNDVRLPIIDQLKQWRVWLVHHNQLLTELKVVAQNPDSLPAVEGMLSRVELEAFFPVSSTATSNANLAPSPTSMLLRHPSSANSAIDLRQKEFQEFIHHSPAVVELVNLLAAQRTRLTARSKAIMSLKEALLSENSEAISQALKLAETGRLESPLVHEAQALLSRLVDEQKMVAELSKAMAGSDRVALERALDNTKRIALDAERSALIHTAINTLHRLYAEHLKTNPSASAETQAFLTHAQNYGYIPEAVVHTAAPSLKLTEKKAPPPPPAKSGGGLFASFIEDAEPAAVETKTHNRGNSLVRFEEENGKKQHVRVASDGIRQDAFAANSFELSNSPFMLAQRTQLDQAIHNRDLEALQKLMGAMNKSDFGHDRSRQVRRAEALAKHLEHEKAIEAALEAAIQDLDQEALRGLLKEAALCGMPVSETMRTARNICYEIPAQELLELKVENALEQVKDDLSNVDVIKEKITILLKQMEELDMKHDYWARKARLFLRAGTPRAHVSFKLNSTDKSVLMVDMKARRSFTLLPDSSSQYADVINTPRNHHPLSKFSGLRDPTSFSRLSMFKKPKNVLESMCRYQKKQLSSSLTQVSKDKVKLCKEMFQNLLGYMKITYHPYPVTLGHAVIMSGVNNPELRDEIYAQLIKQTSYKIPKLGPGAKRKPIVKPGMVHCWVLLYFTINSFSPHSEEMKPVILDHIVASTHLPQGGEFDPIVQYAMHCYAAYNVMIKHPEGFRVVPASLDQLRLASDGELEFTQVEMSVLELVDKDRTDLEKPVRNKVKAAKIRQYNKEYFTDSLPTQFDVEEKPCEIHSPSARVRTRRNTGGSTLLSPGAAAAAIAQGESDGNGSPSRMANRNSLLLSSPVPRIAYPVSPNSPNQRQSMTNNLQPLNLPPPSLSPMNSPNQRHSVSGNPPPTNFPRVVSDVGEMPL